MLQATKAAGFPPGFPHARGALPRPLLGQQTLYLEGKRGDVSLQMILQFRGAGGSQGPPMVEGPAVGWGRPWLGQAGPQQGQATPWDKEAEGRTMGMNGTWQLEIRDVTGPVWTLGTQDPAGAKARSEARGAEGRASLRTAEAEEWQGGRAGDEASALKREGPRRLSDEGAPGELVTAGCPGAWAGRPGEPDAGRSQEPADGCGRGEGASEGTGLVMTLRSAGQGLFVRQRPLTS